VSTSFASQVWLIVIPITYYIAKYSDVNNRSCKKSKNIFAVGTAYYCPKIPLDILQDGPHARFSVAKLHVRVVVEEELTFLLFYGHS